MGITVTIAGVNRTINVDAKTLSITDEVTNRASSAQFDFYCQDIAIAPVPGASILIEEGTTKLFSGRILSKVEGFLPPALLSYNIECIDNTRDLDKYLVSKTYTNQSGGDIIKDIVDNYTTGFTYAHVQDGPTLYDISFDYIQASEAIAAVANACGYYWYIDWDKDIYFFLKTDYPASFQLDDDQEHHKELVINFDVSQLRNRVYVKSSKYETLDFTELFIGDGTTVTWTCKYTPNATPSPTLKLDGVAKTVGWDTVDNPALFDFMLNAATGVLSLGTESTPGAGEKIVPTYGADKPIIISWDDTDSIAAIKAIEGGDGIFEYCITNNDVDTKEWAEDLAKADLKVNANPVITGSFLTNESSIRSGQIITLDSTKRGLTQDFLVQRVALERVDIFTDCSVANPYKPAATATIGYKPAATAEVPYVEAGGVEVEVIYYLYRVTIATKLKGLEDLLLELLYDSSESIKRDTTPPAVPTGLALTTGMGEINQAGLTWLKAAWEANTEDDFDHYELKYKKTAYSDFGLVTTTDVTFIWVGLEQNIEYQVYIRAVDVYGNRSAWSSVETQTTATDSEVPTQVGDQVATAIVGGIKVAWTRNLDTNIAYYLVDRQESVDGTTWTGAWTERARINGDLWLDLFLSYTTFYRYRITAYTQTGTAGVTSGVTANSISPSRAGADDIVKKCITAAEIYGTKLSVIFADMGQITAGDITLDSAGFIRTKDKESFTDATAGFWLGYDGAYKLNIGNGTDFLKWNGSNLSLHGSITITGGSGIASLTDAGDLATKDEVANTDLGTTIISGGYLRTDLIKVKKLYVGGGTSEDIYFEDSHIRIYDAASGSYKRIKWYNTDASLDFAALDYISTPSSTFKLNANSTEYIQMGINGNTNMGWLDINAASAQMLIQFYPSGGKDWTFYGTGHLKFSDAGTTEPSHTGKAGSLIYSSASGSWMHVISSGEDAYRLDVSSGW